LNNLDRDVFGFFAAACAGKGVSEHIVDVCHRVFAGLPPSVEYHCPFHRLPIKLRWKVPKSIANLLSLPYANRFE
jgi:hypothetical protein